MGRMRTYLMTNRFSKEEMLKMENLISSFLQTVEVERTIPIDIFEFATELGFDVRGAELKDQLEGLIIVNEKIDKIEDFNSNKVIAYDCSKDISTKKFIVAHELAHYIDKKVNHQDQEIVVAARDHADDYSKNKNEQKMDYIAASLLIPKDDLVGFLKEHKVIRVSQIAKHYNVPKELAKRRVKEVKCLESLRNCIVF